MSSKPFQEHPPECSGCPDHTPPISYIFPMVILYTSLSFLLIFGALGLRVWGLRLSFWGWGFQLMGFGACGVGPSGCFGVVAL